MQGASSAGILLQHGSFRRPLTISFSPGEESLNIIRRAATCAIAVVACTLFACGGSGSNPSAALPQISQQPSNQAVTVAQTATFAVVATGSGVLSYQWRRNSAAVADATDSTYTTPPVSSSDNAARFDVVISNTVGQVTSSAAVLSVQSPPDVTTFHNDNLRTGQNLSETILTPSTVTASRFGKVGFLSADGKVDAQPLYLAGVTIGGEVHNVLYVVTEHDSIYAYDADSLALLWQTTALLPGETSSDDRLCSEAVTPELGITSTPVIDRTKGPNGALYLVAATEDTSGFYHHRLHAFDVSNGAELFGGPAEIQARYPGTGEGSDGTNVIFDPAQYFDRAALLLANGTIYTSWASHCDIEPYTGWIIGFDESTLRQTRVLDITPNGDHGGIWMSGDGPAADPQGNVYLLDGNGLFDTVTNSGGFPNHSDYGNAIVKIAPAAPATVVDFFAPSDTATQSAGDYDLGSGGIFLLPDLVDNAGKTWHLALGSGKTGFIYVVDRDNMGKFNPSGDNIAQEIPRCCGPYGGLYGPIFSTPAYFDSMVYFGAVGEPIEAFSIADGKLSLPFLMLSKNSFPYPGATPSISANGASNALLWAVENGTPTGILHAYDANNLQEEVYTSSANPDRDGFGSNKFIVPTVVNGRVYVGTPNGVAVFGILPSSR